MTPAVFSHTHMRRFLQDEAGTTLVELAIVLPVFLLLYLGLIDFGRLGAEYVLAEKAMQRASRIAAVRPAACPNVPLMNRRGSDLTPHYGAACSAAAGICADPGVQSCTGSLTVPPIPTDPNDPTDPDYAAYQAYITTTEIWASIRPLMPNHATIANLRFSYAHDPRLGFLGGPYVPIVTVEIQNLNFQFATPLSALGALAGSNAAGPGATLPFPSMSTSLPAEDLALGNNG